MPRHASVNLAETFAKILCERASFELKEDDVNAYRQHINSLQQAAQVTAAARAQEEEEYRHWKAQYPGLLESFAKFIAGASGKRVAVFLDYDGTLTPIVKNPDRAYMSDQMRDAVKSVARLFPTAIISGRGREKVEGFVQLQELYYAGSHGMDIIGPRTDVDKSGSKLAFQPAARFAPVMDQVHDALSEGVRGISGATVEHNKFCVSVHFRNVDASQYDAVLSAVEATLQQHQELHATRGRKVFEIRPQVDWDKGRALLHLLGALGLDTDAGVLPIYIGDDRTDEDAFAALRSRSDGGTGILVSSKVKPTEASYTLRDPHEVLTFLTRLVEWGQSPANAWHQRQSCIGWALNTSPSTPSCSQNGIHVDEPQANGDGDANGDAATPTARNMAESKLSAFGLPISRSLLMRQRSGGVPPRCGGRPPLAPMSPEPPSSATSSSRSLNVGQGAWSLTAEPCTSGYETPTQGLDTLREHHSFTDQGGGEGQPKRQAVDLSQLSLQDTNEEEVAGMLEAAVARSNIEDDSRQQADRSGLLSRGLHFPKDPVSAAKKVLAGLGLPGTRAPKEDVISRADSELPSTVASGGYSSGGDTMHLTNSGKLVDSSYRTLSSS